MNDIVEKTEEIIISTGKVYRTNENLIHYEPIPTLITHTIEQMEEIGIAFKKVLNGEKLPYIVDVNRVTKFGAKEKDLAREKLKAFYSAAFVTKSSISRVLLSVFLIFHRKEPIIKIFSSMEEAKNWSIDLMNSKNVK